MSILDTVVNACPFRVGPQRALTPWEWLVIEHAIAQEIGRIGHPQVEQAAASLRQACQNSQCHAWKATSYGPPPAVSTVLYRKLARWWGSLNAASQQSALAAVASGQLLCGPEIGVWNTPQYTRTGWGGDQTIWEGDPQVVPPQYALSPPDPIALTRMRTGYIAMTGQQALSLIQALQLGGGLVQQLSQLSQYAPPQFLNREFLVGVCLKSDLASGPGGIGAILNQGNVLLSAPHVLDELALIWAPGRGYSLLPFVTGVNPQQLAGLLAAIGPDMLGGLLPAGLPIPQIPGLENVLTQVLPGILQSLPNMQGTYPSGLQFGPASRQSTGYPLVDQPAQQFADQPAPPIPKGTTVAGTWSAFDWLVAAGVVGIIMTAWWMRRRQGA